VRITTQGRVKRYVDYAVRLLIGPQDRGREDQEKEEEKGTNEHENRERTGPSKQFDTIVLKATGRAIYSAVTTAEVVKRKVANLHQLTKLDTLEMTDVWEPLEEGLKEVKTTRRVASISITLSRHQSEVDSDTIGYQEPIPAESVGARGGRSRGRGYRGGYAPVGDRDTRRSYGRNGTGFRGERSQQDRESYSDRRYGGGGTGGGGFGGRGRGRGRGRGGGRGYGGGYGGGYGDRRQDRSQGGGPRNYGSYENNRQTRR